MQLTHTLLYRTIHRAADAAGIADRTEIDRRIAICYRCPHTDGLGCAEFGCSDNPTTLARWRAIVLDPERHCPIADVSAW